jgi:hypothetical protein
LRIWQLHLPLLPLETEPYVPKTVATLLLLLLLLQPLFLPHHCPHCSCCWL